MYYNLIDKLIKLFLTHKDVYTVLYQNKLFNNAQNNYKPIQVYIESQSYSRLNIGTGIFIVELNIWILRQPSNDRNGVLSAQSQCYGIANSVINHIDFSNASVYDYSIVTVSEVTDDNSSGVRMTLQLQVPLEGLCDDDEWREEPISQQEKDHEIKVKVEGDKPINLNPTKLERIPRC